MAFSGSPESDVGSFECFQNYTAPEVFVQGLAGQINQQDVEAIIRAQKQMLQRFEKTNEMLSNCNSLSNSRFVLAQKELKKHTTLLHDMKKDLDNIFRRIRNLKVKVATHHPAAYGEVQQSMIKKADDDDGEEDKDKSQLTNVNPPQPSLIEDVETQLSADVVATNERKTDTHAQATATDDEKQQPNPAGRNEANSSSCDSISSKSGKNSSSSSFDN